MFLVEATAEGLGDDPGFGDAVKGLAGQALLPEAGVETLREPVLPRLSGRNQVRPDGQVLQPKGDIVTNEFRPVVAADELRCPRSAMTLVSTSRT